MGLLSRALALCLLCAGARARAEPPLVLISIDGLRPDLVIEADRYGARVPHLRRLLTEGARASGVEPVLPAVTYPGHTTLVTGVSPRRHGIVNNRPFDPLGRNQKGWYWYAEDIQVPTLWDAAARAGLLTANVDWPATVGARIALNIPQYFRVVTEDGGKLLRALSTPGLLAEAEARLGPYPVGKDYSAAADRKRAIFAAHLLQQRRPRLLLLHLGAYDAEAHASGPFSAASLRTLAELDGQVGLVRQAAERAGGGRAIIAVVSDHGFLPVTRQLHLNAALRQAGLIDLDARGQVRAYRAFAWPACGSAAVHLADPTDAVSRERVRELLRGIQEERDGAIARVLEGEEARRLDGFPEASFVLFLRDGTEMGFGIRGAVTTAGRGGTHGYAPEHPDMAASLFLAGPGIPAGQDLGRVPMRDIAPTLAALLGVTLPGAEGRNLLAAPGVALTPAVPEGLPPRQGDRPAPPAAPAL